jgi:hypothetical protein
MLSNNLYYVPVGVLVNFEKLVTLSCIKFAEWSHESLQLMDVPLSLWKNWANVKQNHR